MSKKHSPSFEWNSDVHYFWNWCLFVYCSVNFGSLFLGEGVEQNQKEL